MSCDLERERSPFKVTYYVFASTCRFQSANHTWNFTHSKDMTVATNFLKMGHITLSMPVGS